MSDCEVSAMDEYMSQPENNNPPNRTSILHILRNPSGHSEHLVRRCRLLACDDIEAKQKKIENLDLTTAVCVSAAKTAVIKLNAYKDLVEAYGIGHHKDCNNRYDKHLKCNCDKDTVLEKLK